MKRNLLLGAMSFFVLALFAQEQKEVVTGAGYVNDVYYSLENGGVATVDRMAWDIGFTTDNFSSSILANNGAGVEVYTYPSGDTADWTTLDTTGMTWTPMYNSLETFEEGAFGAQASGHPDYGWGTYNPNTHDLSGDSLYVVKTVAGVYKKLVFSMRGSIANTWEFKFANLDGSDEHSILLNSGDYKTKSFVFYSLDSIAVANDTAIIDREPAKADWDLLFTKYWDYTIPYSVTGLLTNEDHILAQEVKEESLDQTTFVAYEDTSFESNISIVGSDWKSFNMGTFTYDVDSTVVFFIKKYGETDSSYYKLYFTAFDYMEGKYVFMQEKLSLVSVPKTGLMQMLKVYPNPASENVNVLFDHTGEAQIQIIDMTGRTVYSTLYRAGGFSNLSLDISQLNPGLFFLKLDAENETGVVRFIKE